MPTLLEGRERLHEADPRADVFNRVLDFILMSRPKAFILENVQQFSPSLSAECLRKEMSRSLSGDGQPLYHFFAKPLNSRFFGTPQNRERLFMVGILNTPETRGRRQASSGQRRSL